MFQFQGQATVSTSKPIASTTSIGHIHLKVADIDRSLEFYHDVLGFDVVIRMGNRAAFLSAGGYHHHLGLNTWESLGGTPPPPGSTGLHHTCILYKERTELADALRRLIRAEIAIDAAYDLGVCEAIQLHDPDGNGVELCWDRPRDQWPSMTDGDLSLHTGQLDLDDLLSLPELP